MSDEHDERRRARAKPDHEPPKGAETTATWGRGRAAIEYTATGKWTVLRKKEKPARRDLLGLLCRGAGTTGTARSPSSSTAARAPRRPICTWARVGPQRVDFPSDGRLPADACEARRERVVLARVHRPRLRRPGRNRLQPRHRAREEERRRQGRGAKPDDALGPEGVLRLQARPESLCEFMGRWLSEHGRWGLARLHRGRELRRLSRRSARAACSRRRAGIGLNGAILISPALEITGLAPTDYDVLGWVDRVPTMAAAAFHHGRSRAFRKGTSVDKVLPRGGGVRDRRLRDLRSRQRRIRRRSARAILHAARRHPDRLPLDVVARVRRAASGSCTCVRELLRDEREGARALRHDDHGDRPVPDRDDFAWPDPTLSGHQPGVHAWPVNRMLRSEIGVETDREYTLLFSYEVNLAWKNDAEQHAFAAPPGATDDFRYGMALNPHMKAFYHARAVRPRRRRTSRATGCGTSCALDPQMAEPPDRPALRRRAHVLRVGDEPARVHGGDRCVRRGPRSSPRSARYASARRFGAWSEPASSIRSASCARSARSTARGRIGSPRSARSREEHVGSARRDRELLLSRSTRTASAPPSCRSRADPVRTASRATLEGGLPVTLSAPRRPGRCTRERAERVPVGHA